MNLYNTQTESIDVFNPPNHVLCYTCGIAPYNTTHLGHAFTYFVCDVLIRFLEGQGKNVTYVQNVIDIDVDIDKKAAEEGQDWRILGNRWTRHFIEDMQRLNMRPPDHFPQATAGIPKTITVVQDLLQPGMAYEWTGNVYFHFNSWPEFGKLSGFDPNVLMPISNESGSYPEGPHKRDPLDFVLWQAETPGELAGESPWGLGRPGWHIECSKMARRILCDTIDQRPGGGELKFPQNELEIAQTKPITGVQSSVRLWLPVDMVKSKGEKMSESLGNRVMVRDLLQEHSADTIRIYLAMHHYRKPWDHSWIKLFQANALDRAIKQALEIKSLSGKMKHTFPFQEAFDFAMENDLNTPMALMVIQDLVLQILEDGQIGNDVTQAQDQLRSLGNVLGLQMDNHDPFEDVLQGWDKHLQKYNENHMTPIKIIQPN